MIIKMKNVVLTGASDGLGREFGRLCVDNGICVVALCRTKPDYKCDFIKTDLSDEKSIRNACESIKENYQRIDMLVNCAGIPGIQKIEDVSFDVLDNLMKVNLLAPILLTTRIDNFNKGKWSRCFKCWFNMWDKSWLFGRISLYNF